MDFETADTLTAACIFVAVAGAVVMLLAHKDEPQLRRKGIAFFAAGMGGVAYLFLLTNTDVLESVRRHLGWVLIGMVIAFVSILKHLR